jgi:hypothetical protein
MKILYALVFCLIPQIIFSQTLSPEAIFCSSDTHVEKGYGQISWTLGDAQTNKFEDIDSLNILTQGFLQSRIEILGVKNIANNENIQVKLFPNPVIDILKIELLADHKEQIIFELFSVDGKVLTSNIMQASDRNTQIDFSKFQYGLYFLRASTSKKTFSQTYKILYQE